MIHDKLMAGQLMLDLKTDRNHLLQTAAIIQQSTHAMIGPPYMQSHQIHSPSPPIPALELYSAYAYQQQLQQHLLNQPLRLHHYPNQYHHHQNEHEYQTHYQGITTTAAGDSNSPNWEVLDLSRRCDSVETNRKTPSPYHSNSSSGSNSPNGSPSTAGPAMVASTTAGLNSSFLTTNQYLPSNYITTHPPIPVPAINFNSLYPGIRSNHLTIKEEFSTRPTTIKTTIANSPIERIESTYATTTTYPPAQAPATASAPVLPVASSLVGSSGLLVNFNPLQAGGELQDIQKTVGSHTVDSISATTTAASLETSTLSLTESRTTRPFKAYPRDPLVIAANFAANDILLDNSRAERYTEYRKRVLEQIRHSNGGSRTVSNPKMRRINSSSISLNEDNTSDNEEHQATEESSDCDSNSGKQSNPMVSTTATTATTATPTYANSTNNNGLIVRDAAYYERRRKNNAAAKKSRDRRRIKEDEIAIRAAYLERQNIELLCQIDALKAQLATFTNKVVV